MAIRLKYDAAAVVIPEDKAQQRFGQQLVQQQQKYANDQRQDIQTRMYDQQRLGMQNAAQANLMAMQGQQALERMNQAQQFGVQQNEAAQAAQMQQRDLGVFDTQLKTLNGMAQDALKNPNMPMDSKRRIQELLVGKGAVNGARFDDQQRQQYLSGYQKEMSGLLSQVQPEDPQHVKDNKGLSHYVPSLGRFASPDELTAMKKENPNLEVHAFQDGKMLPAPTPPKEQPKIPTSYEEHVSADVVKAQKELDAMKERMRGQAEDAGTPYTDENKLRADATAALKGDYDHLLGLSAKKMAEQNLSTPSQPTQSGQPATPTNQSGKSVQATGASEAEKEELRSKGWVQTGESTWELPLSGTVPQEASQASQTVQKPWVPWIDRAVGEEYVDLDGSILVKTPTGVVSKGKVPPGTPLPVEAGVAPPDQSMSQTARDVAAADAAVSDSVPPVAAEQASLDALFPQDNTPAVTTQSPKSQTTSAPTPIGETIRALETGTPEEKRAVRQSIDPKMAMDLRAQVLAGNPDAIQQMDALEKSISKQDEYESSIAKLKSQDPTEKLNHVTALRQQAMEGQIKPQDFVGQVLDAQGKKASEIYKIVEKNDQIKNLGSKYSDSGAKTAETMASAINALQDEMGLQPGASQKDVISHVAKVGKMSMEDAKEYVYKEILSRGYLDGVFDQFAKELPKASREQQKEDKNRNWKPHTNY